MEDSNDETQEEIMPLRPSKHRRQRQQVQFSEEEEDKEEKPLPSFKPPGRASRFLSICQPSLQLPGESLLRLQQLHNQAINNKDSFISDEISDELLDTIPFRIEIIPDRRDDLDMPESTLTKSREKHSTMNKESLEMPTIIPSGLSDERRLEIIEEILKDLSQKNILDEIRRANSIPFQLPKTTQMQKNVAERIRDLTGSEVIMLNDHLYMKNLCKVLNEKHKEKLEANFERMASTEKRRELFY